MREQAVGQWPHTGKRVPEFCLSRRKWCNIWEGHALLRAEHAPRGEGSRYKTPAWGHQHMHVRCFLETSPISVYPQPCASPLYSCRQPSMLTAQTRSTTQIKRCRCFRRHQATKHLTTVAQSRCGGEDLRDEEGEHPSAEDLRRHQAGCVRRTVAEQSQHTRDSHRGCSIYIQHKPCVQLSGIKSPCRVAEPTLSATRQFRPLPPSNRPMAKMAPHSTCVVDTGSPAARAHTNLSAR